MNIPENVETWLLEQLDQTAPNAGEIILKLSEWARSEGVDKALPLAQLAETTFAEKGMIDDALRLLRLRADWLPAIEFRKLCAASAQKIIGNTPEHRAFIKCCGLEQRVPIAEALDRLDLLRALKEGSLVVDKTWGFGIVQQVDPFYAKVTIDFDRKPSHEMSLSYAAESLELLTDDHLLAINHSQPETMQEWVREKPADVVRLTLRSYGPLSSVILQEKLVPSIVPATDWKRFWDAARKELKKDPSAVMPSKRTDPILLKDAAEAYSESWFRQLKSDRDIESILSKISDWLALQDHVEVDPLHRAVIEDRLAFVIKGADLMGKTIKPRAMMIARAVGSGEAMGVDAYVHSVLESEDLLPLVEAMSAKDMKAFIAFLMDVDREHTLQTLVRLVPRLDVTSLTEVLQILIREGEEDSCRQAIKSLFNARRAEVEILSWLSRNMDKLFDWELCAPSEFAEVMLLEMEKDYMGARLKAQNQLRDRFTQKAWVKALFDHLGAEGRERYFLRLKDSSAWPTMEKRSVLGHIIKQYPDLEKLMSGKSTDKDTQSAPRGMVTSVRSFRERQLLLERIKTVDIPKNSKEIATAREHGDLRENFEYQAAKDAQGLLMRRQAELQQMLGSVTPSQFENMPTETAGVGTGIEIAYPDGRTENYFILGVWDRDETLGIISCESKLAKAVEGRAAGESIRVPTEAGETAGILQAVKPLSDAVVAWIADVPETIEGRSVTA